MARRKHYEMFDHGNGIMVPTDSHFGGLRGFFSLMPVVCVRSASAEPPTLCKQLTKTFFQGFKSTFTIISPWDFPIEPFLFLGAFPWPCGG